MPFPALPPSMYFPPPAPTKLAAGDSRPPQAGGGPFESHGHRSGIPSFHRDVLSTTPMPGTEGYVVKKPAETLVGQRPTRDSVLHGTASFTGHLSTLYSAEHDGKVERIAEERD